MLQGEVEDMFALVTCIIFTICVALQLILAGCVDKAGLVRSSDVVRIHDN